MAIVIWDRFVRCFHWLVAALFLLNYWLLEGGEDLHEWAGYTVAALVTMRIVWGFVGKGHARFAEFLPTPSRLRSYLREFPRAHVRYAGHNPLGGLMILFLLFLLLVVAISGWMQELDAFWGEDWVQNLHSWGADILQVAVVIHVVAVLVMQRMTGVALIRTMITGHRNSHKTPDLND